MQRESKSLVCCWLASRETLNKDGFLNFHLPRVFCWSVFVQTCRFLLQTASQMEGFGASRMRLTPFPGMSARFFKPLCVALR
jgi:hypothetical protein